MEVDVTTDAAQFIRDHGGRVFIWVDKAGLLNDGTSPPDHAEEWDRVDVSGIEVNVGETASAASKWWIRLHDVPWKRLDMTSDLTIGVGPPSPPPAF